MASSWSALAEQRLPASQGQEGCREAWAVSVTALFRLPRLWSGVRQGAVWSHSLAIRGLSTFRTGTRATNEIWSTFSKSSTDGTLRYPNFSRFAEVLRGRDLGLVWVGMSRFGAEVRRRMMALFEESKAERETSEKGNQQDKRRDEVDFIEFCTTH